MSDIPTFEPKQIVIGDTLTWTKRLTDFPPSDGWTLTYYYRGTGAGFDAAATTGEGSEYAVTVPAADTATMSAGPYYWQAFVSRGVDETLEQYLVDKGNLTVIAGFPGSEVGVPVDGRSQAKQILDAIDAMVLGKASLDQQEYTIGTRQLKRIPIEELIALRSQYATIYAREQRADALAQGAPYFKTIHARFVRPS